MKQIHIKKKKYEINFLIYTLFFLVIYHSNCHFYKCQPNTQLFQKTLFNSFYQTLSQSLFPHCLYFIFVKNLTSQSLLQQVDESTSPHLSIFFLMTRTTNTHFHNPQSLPLTKPTHRSDPQNLASRPKPPCRPNLNPPRRLEEKKREFETLIHRKRKDKRQRRKREKWNKI